MAEKEPVTKVTREWVASQNEAAQFADGFDDCIIGVVRRFGMEPVALYDYERVIRKLIEDDKMDRETAEEFFEFSIVGAYVGEGTPAFFVNPNEPILKESGSFSVGKKKK